MDKLGCRPYGAQSVGLYFLLRQNSYGVR